jgi:predicted DNA-binding ribbon-helix-helix protein
MTSQLPETNSLSLYEQDYLLWIETTLNQLRQGRLTELDLTNLIEEIEDMGNSQKLALESNLRVLLMHLLKWKYQPERRTNSWKYTIVEHRKRIIKSFKTSPSLKRYFEQVFAECYQDAVDLASAETGLLAATFPDQSPFSQEDVININYLPN